MNFKFVCDLRRCEWEVKIDSMLFWDCLLCAMRARKFSRVLCFFVSFVRENFLIGTRNRRHTAENEPGRKADEKRISKKPHWFGLKFFSNSLPPSIGGVFFYRNIVVFVFCLSSCSCGLLNILWIPSSDEEVTTTMILDQLASANNTRCLKWRAIVVKQTVISHWFRKKYIFTMGKAAARKCFLAASPECKLKPRF